MFKLITFVLILTVVSATSDDKWEKFKKKFNKNYSPQEDSERRIIWHNKFQKIEHHNAGNHGYTLGENDFMDWTYDEYSRLNGLLSDKIPKPHQNYCIDCASREKRIILPQFVDWRTHGYVTPVGNQGLCGSCYAFTAAGSLEGQYFRKTGKLITMSKSNLVDCTWSYNNYGCLGGLMDQCYQYIGNKSGINTEAVYPYQPYENTCRFDPYKVVAPVRSYIILPQDEYELKKAVAEVGPIGFGMDASLESFQLYKSGIYNDSSCNSFNINHGMLMVGYGTENGRDYWLAKNSWGVNWGEDGYVRMSRNNNNQCGVATYAVFPLL